MMRFERSPVGVLQQSVFGWRASVMKLLTVKSCWLLSVPDDSHTLRRKMEVIGETLARFTDVL